VKLKTAVIILNWNGLKDTLECLESIYSSRHKHPFDVFVVDNHSSDNSVSTISRRFSQVKLLENPKNLGFAGGNNVGLKYAKDQGFKHFILLNNDTTITDNSFSELVDGALKHKFDLASPKIYFSPGREFHHDQYSDSDRGHILWYSGGAIDWPNVLTYQLGVNEYDHGQFDQPTQTEFATGCCLYISAKTIDTIGFLDTGYLAYYEDTDYCVTAKKHGLKVGFIPTSLVWHKNAGSTGSGTPRQTKIQTKSRLRFGLRHAPLRAKLALIKHTFFS